MRKIVAISTRAAAQKRTINKKIHSFLKNSFPNKKTEHEYISSISKMIGRLWDMNLSYLVTIILTIQNLIIFCNGDRGSFVGCYRKNPYFKRLEIFSGSSETCISGCESIFFR